MSQGNAEGEEDTNLSNMQKHQEETPLPALTAAKNMEHCVGMEGSGNTKSWSEFFWVHTG